VTGDLTDEVNSSACDLHSEIIWLVSRLRNWVSYHRFACYSSVAKSQHQDNALELVTEDFTPLQLNFHKLHQQYLCRRYIIYLIQRR
jgi:hypothetical protein